MSAKTKSKGPTIKRLDGALNRASEYLLGEQTEAGYWCGTVEMGVTTTLQDFLQRAFLDILDDAFAIPTANYIRAWQTEDGGWPKFNDGPSELSPSIEAYLALRIAGDSASAPHMVRAAESIKNLGGIQEAPGFPTRFWLATFGIQSWDEVHPVPPELLYLPANVPGNLLDFAAWVRQMLASFSIFTVKKPVRSVEFDLDELKVDNHTPDQGIKEFAEKFVLAFNRRPISLLQSRALRKAENWLVDHQDEAGYWCGGFSYAPMSLHVAGRPMDDPIVSSALIAIDKLGVMRGDQRYTQPLNSHIGDTCLAVPALIGAGMKPSSPPLVKAGDWLLSSEVRMKGDFAGKRPDAIPGAWPFEIGNNWYPDNDDTSWAIRALRMIEFPEPERADDAIGRGLRWMIEMQSKDGGWGAFDADNDSKLGSTLYDNAGPVIDPPSADLTAHVLQSLAEEGLGDSDAVRRGVKWIWDHQEPEGPWEGRWFINYIFGVSSVALALRALGMEQDERLLRAVEWLKGCQNEDGGWGETFHSYRDKTLMGQGPSTPSQTAWAIQALVAVGDEDDHVHRGVNHLLATQNKDGSWDEPSFTAASLTPFYDIRYSLMAEVTFALTALGDYRQSIDGVTS